MEENASHEGELQQEQTMKEMNTPVVTARQMGKEKYCNVIRNNEIVISIIF
jgi:hypothetical protein